MVSALGYGSTGLSVGQRVFGLTDWTRDGTLAMVTQLAREARAYVLGTGRTADRETALDFGAKEFVDLENEALEPGARSGVILQIPQH